MYTLYTVHILCISSPASERTNSLPEARLQMQANAGNAVAALFK